MAVKYSYFPKKGRGSKRQILLCNSGNERTYTLKEIIPVETKPASKGLKGFLDSFVLGCINVIRKSRVELRLQGGAIS